MMDEKCGNFVRWVGYVLGRLGKLDFFPEPASMAELIPWRYASDRLQTRIDATHCHATHCNIYLICFLTPAIAEIPVNFPHFRALVNASLRFRIASLANRSGLFDPSIVFRLGDSYGILRFPQSFASDPQSPLAVVEEQALVGGMPRLVKCHGDACRMILPVSSR